MEPLHPGRQHHSAETLIKVHTGNRFGTTGICDADELGHKDSVGVVVPVTEVDGVVAVVGVRLIRRVNDQRCAQTIGVLPLDSGFSICSTSLS